MSNIFQINPDKEPVQSSYEYYALFGKHSFIDNENNPRTNDEKSALAYKKILESDNPQYYIKVGLYGKIFNPIGLYSEGKANKFMSKVGKNEFQFTRVNQKVFDMYVNFLRTKNTAWLSNAERELT